MDVKTEIRLIFEDNGVDTNDLNQIKEMDSLQYMTIIVEIEQKYHITLPDYFLDKNFMENYDTFVSALIDYLDENSTS